MKKVILFISVCLFFFSCKSFKDLKIGNKPNSDVATRLDTINLNNYELYIRQIAREAPPKGYMKKRFGGDRYIYSPERWNVEDKPLLSRELIEILEIQYLFISKIDKKVILISTIPPFYQAGKMIYDYALFKNDNVVNIDYFNYFKFGTLQDNEILFNEDKPTHIHYTENDKYILFKSLDIKTEIKKLDDDFPIPTKYFKKENWNILFHREVQPEVSCNDYNEGLYNQKLVQPKVIYYDRKEDRVYFNLMYEDNNQHWIYFRSDRVMSKYETN